MHKENSQQNYQEQQDNLLRISQQSKKPNQLLQKTNKFKSCGIAILLILIVSTIGYIKLTSPVNQGFPSIEQLQKDPEYIYTDQQWFPVTYSDKKFQKPRPIEPLQCQRFSKKQFPICNNLKQQWLHTNYTKDRNSIKHGNLTQQSLNIARQYFYLGLQQPNQDLIDRQKSYYLQRYPDFFDYKQQLHFCVFMVSYKNADFQRYRWSIRSVLRQQYQNYHIVYVDDVSGDGTGYLAQQYINQNAKNPERHKVVINNFRRLSLQNMYILGTQYCGQHDILFSSPDGDDALSGVLTFQLYNYYYQKFDIWVSYSAALGIKANYVWTGCQLAQKSLQKGQLKMHDAQFISPPRVFYAKLWKMVRAQKMIDSDGTFYKSRQDHITMLSVGQFGRYHIKHIPEINYLYHNEHALNDRAVFSEIISKNRQYHMREHYEQDPLKCLFPAQNGQCIKASEYVLIQNKNFQTKKSTKQQNQISLRNQNNYPRQIKNIQRLSKQQIKNWGISQDSYDIALEYQALGLKQPSQMLISKQKRYYQNKYNLTSINIQFPICVFITGSENTQNDRYKLALNSVFRQQYKNYHIVYVDDASEDGTGDRVKQYINKLSESPQKHKVIFGRIKRNATYNQYIYAKQHCQPLDIQIIIRASDCLVGTQVFKLYNYHFQRKNTWAVFGSYLNVYTGHLHQNQNAIKQALRVIRLNNEDNNRTIAQKLRNYQQFTEKIPVLKNNQVHPLAFYTQLWLNVNPKILLNQKGWFYWAQTSLAVSKRILDQAKYWQYIPQILYLKVDSYQTSEEVLHKEEMAYNKERIISVSTNPRQCITIPPSKFQSFNQQKTSDKQQSKDWVKISTPIKDSNNKGTIQIATDHIQQKKQQNKKQTQFNKQPKKVQQQIKIQQLKHKVQKTQKKQQLPTNNALPKKQVKFVKEKGQKDQHIQKKPTNQVHTKPVVVKKVQNNPLKKQNENVDKKIIDIKDDKKQAQPQLKVTPKKDQINNPNKQEKLKDGKKTIQPQVPKIGKVPSRRLQQSAKQQENNQNSADKKLQEKQFCEEPRIKLRKILRKYQLYGI